MNIYYIDSTKAGFLADEDETHHEYALFKLDVDSFPAQLNRIEPSVYYAVQDPRSIEYELGKPLASGLHRFITSFTPTREAKR